METANLKKKYVKLLEDLAQEGDTEIAHGKADTLLADLLLELGYKDVVEAFDKIEKWYA